ncbi:MAG: sensor histidine kinase KdpD [Phycisphaerae bacterium]|nr:sensor histidine kinase KdpD [Phycisphaerae bacterium]
MAPKSPRGRLTIFFGYAAGVGKTYQMLETAQTYAIKGGSVLIGYVEPHGRPETEAMLLGLDILPDRIVEYRGIKLREFDLDAALQAHPTLIVVDELAHANAPGSRHVKRWQDVEELLEAGIDVYTTLNVQHLESLNDIVAQITEISVHETVPDTVFDVADEIEIVDLSQDDLLERFREGKVYVPTQAERAMQSFFKKPNLTALRELAMRRTADHINREALQKTELEPKAVKAWPTAERLLVCVGPSPTSAAVIRAAKRLAVSLRAEWIAASVETPRTADMSEKSRQQFLRNLKLAEQLGAETVTLSGERVADEILEYAASRHVTKIVVGKTGEPWWLFSGSLVDKVIRRSGDVDVYVIRGVEEPFETPAPVVRKPRDWTGPLYALLTIAVVTAFNEALSCLGLRETNLVMVYMLAVVFVAARFGRNPAIWASVAAVLAFDYFFVKPYWTFAVGDTQYFVTFAVMLIVAVVISSLTARLREQSRLSRQREQRAESLYHLSRELAATTGRQQLLTVAQRRLMDILGPEVTILMPDESGKLKPMVGGDTSFAGDPNELAVAQWVFEHNQLAGAGTDTLPDALALYIPLATPSGAVGVIAVRTERIDQLLAPAQRQLLTTFAGQIALALERDSLSEQAHKILAQAQLGVPKPESSRSASASRPPGKTNRSPDDGG